MTKTSEQKQKTRKGHEIPIPKRSDVLGLFKKAATHQEKAKKSNTSRSPKK